MYCRQLEAVVGSKGPWSTSSKCSIAQEPDFVNSDSTISENHFATADDHIGSPLRDEGRIRRRDGRPRPSENEKGKEAQKRKAPLH